MATTRYDSIGSGDESDPLSPDYTLIPSAADNRSRLGYQQRKQLTEAGAFISGDHGTFLGMQIPEDPPPMDNPTTVALKICNEKVIKPYQALLKSVGWHPIFQDANSCWQKAINVIHPLIVVLLVLMGYVIQFAGCFRRDRAGTGVYEPWDPVDPGNKTNGSVIPSNPPCQKFIISQYIIPDMLHSIAYGYSFYLLRISGSEELATLIERVFLQTTPNETGILSQGQLIRKLRMLLYGSLFWVFLSAVSQIIHVIAQYDTLNFHWLEPSTEFGRVTLVIMMVISFMALDIVYVAVVIHYIVQCLLLIFYTHCIKQKVRLKHIDLDRAKTEVREIDERVKGLNLHPGLAVSTVMINFGTMAFLGFLTILDPDKTGFNPLMYVATILAVILWFIALGLPILAGAFLTASLKGLRKLGHETSVRPFGYETESEADLDSFLIYMSSTRMTANLFFIPVKGSILCGLLVTFGLLLLVLFQTGVLHVWL